MFVYSKSAFLCSLISLPVVSSFCQGIYFYSYIRPHLEYCAPSWLPYLAKDIDALEWVQHRTPKLINSLSIPYPMKRDWSLSNYSQFTACCM